MMRKCLVMICKTFKQSCFSEYKQNKVGHKSSSSYTSFFSMSEFSGECYGPPPHKKNLWETNCTVKENQICWLSILCSTRRKCYFMELAAPQKRKNLHIHLKPYFFFCMTGLGESKNTVKFFILNSILNKSDRQTNFNIYFKE